MSDISRPIEDKEISRLVRPCVRTAAGRETKSPVSSSMLRLHANESPFNSPFNRYPASNYADLKQEWGRHEGIPAKCCHLVRGTEEAVDLVLHTFCTPGKDRSLTVAPSRRVYVRRSELHGVECSEALLRAEDFSLDVDALLEKVSLQTKVIFLCNPNCPTGNLISAEGIAELAELFEGIVVIDESYIDYCPTFTSLQLLNRFSRIIILRSFSHAWAAAGARLCMMVGHPDMIYYLQAAGLSHPVSSPEIEYAKELFTRRSDVDKWTRQIVEERMRMACALAQLPFCKKVYPSVTNFLLVKVENASRLCAYLEQQQIAVTCFTNAAQGKSSGTQSDGRATVPTPRAAKDNRPTDCIRITISLPSENSKLLGALRKYSEL